MKIRWGWILLGAVAVAAAGTSYFVWHSGAPLKDIAELLGPGW